MDVVKSKSNVPIRLTEERWFHITEEYSEMAGHGKKYIDSCTRAIESPIFKNLDNIR